MTPSALAEELQAARWFGGKSRAMAHVRLVDRARWVGDAELRLVEVNYEVGPPETYVLAERLEDPSVARLVLQQFGRRSVATEAGGTLAFTPTHLFEAIPQDHTEPIAQLRGEQSNTSVRFGDALILKLFRRLQFGPNPDVEVGIFLTEHSHFRGTPAVVGNIEYQSPHGATASLALLQRFERNRGDAWTTTLRRLEAVLEGADPADSVQSLTRLGRTTAELHVALGHGSGAFSAEPIGESDISHWRQAIVEEVEAAAHALARRGIVLDTRPLADRAGGITKLEGSLKTRHHGDFHLGQVLERDDGSFVIIDFEGEPSKPLAMRREKRSPLRDVAGMLRSFDYARNAALRAGDSLDPRRRDRAEAWHASVREAYLSTYLGALRDQAPELLPSDAEAPLAAMQLEKAAYEVLYELNNRPDWLPIPLAALQGSDTLSREMPGPSNPWR